MVDELYNTNSFGCIGNGVLIGQFNTFQRLKK
jgi:hypothetical protein